MRKAKEINAERNDCVGVLDVIDGDTEFINQEKEIGYGN